MIAEDIGIEMWQQTHGAIPAGTGDDGLHLGLDPHAHETLCASLVFGAREAREAFDLRIEQNGEARALEGAHAALQPPELRRVGRRNDANGIAFDDRRRPEKRNSLEGHSAIV